VIPDMLRKQLTVIASWPPSHLGKAKYLQFITDRGIDVEKLSRHRWKSEQDAIAYNYSTRANREGRIMNNPRGVMHENIIGMFY